jgi:hypothetical protein
MEIFETNSKFIKKEASKEVPQEAIKYLPKRSAKPNIIIDFPQYELTYNSYFRGDYMVPYTFLAYRGIIIKLKKKEIKEDFLLELLNDLKKGQYIQKMEKFISERLLKAKIDYKPILNRTNIKAEYLAVENETLKRTINKLTQKVSKMEKLAHEIIKFK